MIRQYAYFLVTGCGVPDPITDTLNLLEGE